jgi:hypothetical protein
MRRGWKGLGEIRSTAISCGEVSDPNSVFGSGALGISALRPLPKPFFGVDIVLSTANQLLG